MILSIFLCTVVGIIWGCSSWIYHQFCQEMDKVKVQDSIYKQQNRELLRVVEKMKYHGVLYAWKDKDGYWYFTRSHRICKLW